MVKRIFLLKPTIHDDVMWPIDAVIDMADERRAEYLVGMQNARWATGDEKPTRKPEPMPIRSNRDEDRLAAALENAINKKMTAEKLDAGVREAMRGEGGKANRATL